MTLRVALFRARDDASLSAARLAGRGFLATIAPATEIRATGAPPPPGCFDAAAATSAKALTLLAPAARSALVGLPFYVVGEEGARAAAALGLSLAAEAAPDVATLATALTARLARGSRALYLAGRHRKAVLEAALRLAGVSVATLEVYVAAARAAWSGEEAEAVARCGAALHYSRRSTALAAALAARAGFADRFRVMLHACLSADVAEPLRAMGATRFAVAASPREGALIDALAAALADDRG
jgi:uroporphyrinogen-III synthase